jgi:hypothetical protein
MNLTPEQADFVEKLRDLFMAKDLTICEKIDLTLWGIGRLAIAEGKDLEVGLRHLSGHLDVVVERLSEEESQKLHYLH